jgi:N-acetylmuramoyl-L-alanine amidase
MHLPALARPARALLLAMIVGALTMALPAGTVPHVSPHAALQLSPYDKAQRMREALNGRDQQQRTQRDYERVLDAYRAVYHNDPASPKADASVAAVADLLAEEGRLFDDEKALHDAIGQYEFLRREYPQSRLCPNALLTQAAIYEGDLGDRAQAKSKYQAFLKEYPHSPLAEEARSGLKTIHKEELAEKRGTQPGKSKVIVVEDGPAPAKVAATTKPAKSGQGAATAATSTFPSSQSPPARVSAPSGSTAKATQPLAANPVAVPKEVAQSSTTKPRRGKAPLVTGIRYWSTNVYTRVAIDLDEEVQYEAARVPSPDRIFFDLHGVKLSPELIGRAVEVTDDGYLKKIRAAQFSNDVTRIVLDVSDVSDYSAFLLPNPYRLIIDIHGRKPGSAAPAETASTANPSTPPNKTATAATTAQSVNPAGAARPGTTPSKPAPAPNPMSSVPPANNSASGIQSASAPRAAQPPAAKAGGAQQVQAQTSPTRVTALTPAAQTSHSRSDLPSNSSVANNSSSLEEVVGLSHQKDRVKATSRPTSAPISASVAGTTPAPQQADATPPVQAPVATKATSRKRAGSAATSTANATAVDPPAHEATPTSMGQRSLVRALGLKIGRIVVDAGHGGHDSGTLGPDGIEEKEVVLDVSLRLGKLLKQRLGADVIYTRDDDTFIPLETRTAIANKAQADLFLSVHANSSQDPSARGVETYYLNFTSSADALEVAARENAVSDQSIHQLSDLVKKITLKDKIDESREFAADVQQNLFNGLEDGNRGLKDRGVKKAPFVVLIGANMPSILAEISFLTNPDDARELRDPNYRQRIAESLYRGVSKYIGGLSGVRLAQVDGHAAGK